MQTQRPAKRMRGATDTCAYTLPPSGLVAVTPWRQVNISGACPLAECRYLEDFWLGILGPTATLLARHLSRLVTTQADTSSSPTGITVDVAELGARLGVSTQPLHDSVLSRAINRLVMFKLVIPSRNDDAVLAVRTSTPRLSDRLVTRLHPALQHAHMNWMAQQATGELECCVPQRH
jgi:hypothetical protein